MKNNKSKIIQNILDLIEKSDIFEEHDDYEIMPIVDNDIEMEKIKERIDPDSSQILLFNIAFMYLSVARLLAKQKLSKQILKHWFVWIQLDFDKVDYNENGYFRINLCLTRDKERILKSAIGNKINVKESDIYSMVKNIHELKMFDCYQLSFADEYVGEISYFNFIPKF